MADSKLVMCNLIIHTALGSWYSVGRIADSEHRYYATSTSMDGYVAGYPPLVSVDFSNVQYVIEQRPKQILVRPV